MGVAIQQLYILSFWIMCNVTTPDSIVNELHVARSVHGLEAGADVAEVVQHHVHRHHAPPHGRHWHRVRPDVAANV